MCSRPATPTAVSSSGIALLLPGVRSNGSVVDSFSWLIGAVGGVVDGSRLLREPARVQGRCNGLGVQSCGVGTTCGSSVPRAQVQAPTKVG